MNTYKITNVTNLAGKREYKYNSILDIDYVDGMMRKTIKVKPGDSLYLTVPTLPLSVHRLRVKKLITVTEVSAAEMERITKASKPKPKEVKKETTISHDEDDSSKKSAKKKYTKKEY